MLRLSFPERFLLPDIVTNRAPTRTALLFTSAREAFYLNLMFKLARTPDIVGRLHA
jgi:hypothetical protein